VVLALARAAGFAGDKAAVGALMIVILMALQTLAFAAPDQPRGLVSRRRLFRVLGVRAVGFGVTSLLALTSYVLQRIFILSDWGLHATLLWLLLPIGSSALLDAGCSRPYADEYWTLGRALITGRRRFAPFLQREIGAGFIKIFFYPMMFVYLEEYLRLFDRYWRPRLWSAAGIYDSLSVYCLLVDLIFGATAYALSVRILGNRVRSVNPYPTGWLVTIVCYSPFWDMVGRVLVFQWHADWIVLTRDWPIVQWAWLLMIACCLVVYAWATVEMGPKFSNLTYRGAVVSGPYRLMRHPAYVSKVISYWLITLPFIPLHGGAFALQQCLVLSLSCSIYYFRARYEERHLRHYAEYRAYASKPIFRRQQARVTAA